jgi:DNA polymerase I-like protein with 3'-5' exonuclease and polymerase domains
MLLVYTDISGMELRGIAGISRDPVMIDYFASGKDIYTEAAMAYYVGFLKQNKDYATIRKLYRNPFKLGVISTISKVA